MTVDPFNKAEQPSGDTSSPDVFADQLKLIKNEEGEQKYKDVPTALEALAHAQGFIKTLQTEKAQTAAQLEALRKEAENAGTVKDLLDKFTTSRQEPQPKVDQPQGTALDESKVMSLIQNTLQQQTVARVEEGNLQSVVTKLSDKFGENARTVISDRATQLGTTPEALRELSKKNPEMVLALFGEVQQTPSNKPMSPSSVHIPARKGQEELSAPARSVMRGGMTGQEVAAEWRRVAEHTKRRLGVIEN